MWQTALAAALVVAVAGLSIEMLRNAALNTTAFSLTAGPTIPNLGPTLSPPSLPAAFTPPVAWSYVTPSTSERPGTSMPLRSQLTDYIVAHSEYSTPLMRRTCCRLWSAASPDWTPLRGRPEPAHPVRVKSMSPPRHQRLAIALRGPAARRL